METRKRNSNLFGVVDVKDFVIEIFNEFLKQNDIEKYLRCTSKAAISAEHFKRTIKNLLKKPIFEKGKASWIKKFK